MIDHHQHLFSPAVQKVSPTLPPMNATELVKLLDEAGIRRAVVLSLGYQFGNPNKPPVPDEYSAVKAENDWTAAQIAPFGDRLRGILRVESAQTVRARGDLPLRSTSRSFVPASNCTSAIRTWISRTRTT